MFLFSNPYHGLELLQPYTCTLRWVQLSPPSAIPSNAPFPPSHPPHLRFAAPSPASTCPPVNHPKTNMQRPNALEPRSFGNKRPSSAAPHRQGGGVTSGFRPGSGGARARSARGVGGSTGFLPPAGSTAAAGSQSASHLFSPAALSATYGPLSEAARKVRNATQEDAVIHGRLLSYFSL